MNSQNIPNEAPLIYNQGGGQISPVLLPTDPAIMFYHVLSTQYLHFLLLKFMPNCLMRSEKNSRGTTKVPFLILPL